MGKFSLSIDSKLFSLKPVYKYEVSIMGQFNIYLQKNPLTKNVYKLLKDRKERKINNNLLSYNGHFDNRSKGSEKLCVILAGYKPFLYNSVFPRIETNLSPDIDVCVVSSGVFSNELNEMCKKNGWSYLSTKENDVSLVQNVAINIHPNAKYIYKLDEDIFITEGYFQRLYDAYNRAKAGDYNPGVIAPLLLINGFTTLMILDKIGARQAFTDKFGALKHAAGNKTAIENNVNIAKFLWGEGNTIPHIDDINRQLYTQGKKESACPIRFSIGAILFERELWTKMHYFDVNRKDKYMMGKDEVKLCEYCMINSLPVMVSENIVVGHFSFGAQTEGMKQFYNEHPERFRIQDC